MSIRNLSLVSVSTVAALFGFGYVMGCSGPADDATATDSLAALTACHLNDGTVAHDALIRACDPQDTKKTTICHFPPGNPANAHTLCVGNPAVPAHLKHHGDHVGPCQNETPCPPPPSGDSSGTGGIGGVTGVTGTGGNAGEITIVIP